MDAQTLYTEKADEYVSFSSRFSHRQGLTALLLAENLVSDGQRVLDAGCGAGLASLALLAALGRRGWRARKIDAFDLTPAMLERFARTLRTRAIPGVELRQADVRDPAGLPPAWTGYDLIMSVSMLEYVPRQELAVVLGRLRERLAPAGRMILVITRRNLITRIVVEKPWHAHSYTRAEFGAALSAAGCHHVRFARYPARFFWLSLANHVAIVG